MYVVNRKGMLRAATGSLVISALALSMSACTQGEWERTHEPNSGLTQKDYRELLNRRPQQPPPQQTDARPGRIPDLQPVVVAPRPPAGGSEVKVSVNFNDTVQVRDVLIELARKANVDLELDPRITGGIVFSATQRPFSEVVGRICDLAGLRYTFKNKALRVELDEPYQLSYRIDGLNLSRSTTTKVGVSTNVFTSVSGGSSSSGADNGSTAAIESKSVSDMWADLDKNIRQILMAGRMANASRQERLQHAAKAVDGNVSGVAVPDAAAAAAAAAVTAATASPTAAPVAAGGTTPAGAAAGASDANSSKAISELAKALQPPQPQDLSTMLGGKPTDSAKKDEQQAQSDEKSPFLSINKQAGVISVFADSRTHAKVEDYIKKMTAAMAGQVLIEARVVEVSLLDEFKSGVDWNAVFGDSSIGISSIAAGVAAPLATSAALPTVFSGTFKEGNSLSQVIDLTRRFGTTRTLSSPRLTVLNNQTAVLKVAENQVYFRLTAQTTPATATAAATTTVTSTLETVPIGLVMTVQPSISPDSNDVALTVRPTISRVTGQVSDPAVAIVARQAGDTTGEIVSNIPVVEVREIDSVLRIPSGGVAVMGGLMQERASSTDTGTPGVADIPFLGNLFKQKTESTQLVELVIFLSAKIVDRPKVTVEPADTELYQKYMRDPRPVTF